jgi:hypothetical protein
MSRKPKKYWNFRIITNLHVVPMGTFIGDQYRTYSVVEVYYEEGKPVSYGAKNILSEHENVKGIKWTHKKIKKALKKPILDADNWPKEYK